MHARCKTRDSQTCRLFPRECTQQHFGDKIGSVEKTELLPITSNTSVMKLVMLRKSITSDTLVMILVTLRETATT